MSDLVITVILLVEDSNGVRVEKTAQIQRQDLETVVDVIKESEF